MLTGSDKKPAQSGDARLLQLTVNGTVIAATATGYATTLPYQTANVLIMVSLPTGATALIGDVAGSTRTVPINVGDNPLTIVVIAENGTRLQHQLVVTRQPSSDASLTTLRVDGVAIPATAGEYALSVATGTTAAAIVLTLPEGAAATIRGDTGSTYAATDLAVGPNEFAIVVTAQDGTTSGSYLLVVTRLPPPISGDSSIASLVVNDALVVPVVSAYEWSLGYDDASVEIVLTIAANASATIDGNAGTSVTLPLSRFAFGKPAGNAVTVVVTAEDGTTATNYTMTVADYRLSAPTGLSVAADPNAFALDVSWIPVDHAEGYVVYRGEEVAYEGTAPGFRDDDLAHGSTFEYRVAARNVLGNGPFSVTAPGTTVGDGSIVIIAN